MMMMVSDWLQLSVVNFTLINTMQIGATALLIIFQPELRRGLEHMGRSKFGNLFNAEESAETADFVDETCLAVSSMSKTKTGALIVFERKNIIDEYLTGGTPINADISSELVENIFVPNTPLHDGAVIRRKGRVHAAGWFLPLSSNNDIVKELGTRHRAAIGMSENSDALVLVVSEETGAISVAIDGELKRNLSRRRLEEYLVANLIDENKMHIADRVKGKFFKKGGDTDDEQK